MIFHVRRCAGSRARVWPGASEKQKGVKLPIDTIERLGLAETRVRLPYRRCSDFVACLHPTCGVQVNARDDRAKKRGGDRLGESRRSGMAAGNSQRSGR